MTRTIAIAGAGIGGLAAALSLARVGIRVVLLERAETLREVGAGLQISPNASRILIDLGLGRALDAVAVRPTAIAIYEARSGRELNRIDLAAAAERHGAPYWSIHRADLQGALADAAEAEPLIDLRLGTSFANAVETEAGVTLTLRTDTGEETLGADALIGADGVWSAVRRTALGIPGAAFTGRTAWRAVVPIEAVPDRYRRSGGLWIGPDAHLVHYPVHAGSQVNMVAVVKDDWHEEGWNAPGDPAFLKSRFAAWAPAARDLLGLTDDWLKWALCGMPAAGSPWRRGRIALLGDAAHAMLPFVAQGAAMSIEDGAVLAGELASGADIETALAAYERRRRPRVERIVATALENDRLYHAGGPLAFARDASLKLLPSRLFLARYDWIYGWRADQAPHAHAVAEPDRRRA